MFLATSDHDRQKAADSTAAMAGYLWNQLEQRRAKPTGDLLTHIATVADDLPADVQVKLPIALVVGGWETTAASIATFTYLLATRPYQAHPTGWHYLRTYPERIDAAASELERLYSIANEDGMPRHVTTDSRLPSGKRLSEGDIVIPSQDAANRDPRVFPSPTIADFERHPNPHLGFGYGPHYCIGAHLAALVSRTAITRLLQQLPGLELAVPTSEVRWNAGHAVLGPEHLPIRW